MHELAIAESVVSTVLKHTDARVSVVRLRVGQLTGVVPASLAFCFEAATLGTALEGAVLEIEEERGRAHCRSCDRDFALEDPFLVCPCGSSDVGLLAGRDLLVMSVEVA